MLESIREVVDSLIVVDGAYTAYLEHYRAFVPTANAWSTDGSIEIINALEISPKYAFLGHLEKTCWENQAENAISASTKFLTATPSLSLTLMKCSWATRKKRSKNSMTRLYRYATRSYTRPAARPHHPPLHPRVFH
jgi:hypothetical protein